ncbi:DUF1963 domain-containing protein [Novosphingobium soli]|uniref:DUF1963 domain-containing protein n=1 Tax=Novosphingobium soli TaxID=574956 RepID=UPI0036458492
MRKPRERSRDWFGDRSWFGGLPRLGDRPWPRDAAGTPLPFAAQIDLAELAALTPGAPLPNRGSLAFFLGAGAVVAVPDGADFADPPEGLPPAYDAGGAPFPVRAGRLSRWFFPFWPVEPVALELSGSADDAAIEDALAERLAGEAMLRDHPFYAAGVGAPVEALWWHSMIHLADQLHEALDDGATPLAAWAEAAARQRGALAEVAHDPDAAPYAVQDAREELERIEAEAELLQAQRAELPEMVRALDGFVEGRDPWTPLTAEEREVAADILSEVHERYGEIVRRHVSGSLAQLATISLRAMVSGPPETLAAMPAEVLARINREYRLPPVLQHRMFGAAPEAAQPDGDDLLLLQLAHDDMMEWSWAETGTYRFRIPARAAAAGDWSAARLAFESD